MAANQFGTVVGIYISAKATELPIAVGRVQALAGLGLQGDRYSSGRGTWSHWPGDGRQVTLIEGEVATGLEAATGINAAQLRRNIVTRGLRLNHWVGVDFSIGQVVMRGVRLCEPCAHLETLTIPGLAQALQNSGGLRADIVRGGLICRGDTLRLV